MIEPLRLLAIASRPSDYVEMSDLARALTERGHDVSLLFLYSRDDPSAAGVLDQLSTLSAGSGVRGVAVEISELPDALPPQDAGAETTLAFAGTAPNAVESTAVNALRSTAVWARRHGLSIYPKNTVVGRAAYGATHVIDALRDRARMAQARQLSSNLRPRLRRLPWKMQLEAMFRIYQAAPTLMYYRRSAEFFRKSIARRQLQALLIPEDIVGSVWPVAIKAGHDAGIPTIVLPYTLANREEAIQSLKGAVHYQTQSNRFAAALYPRWRYQHDGIDIVRLPSGHIVAHEDLGIAPPDPWMMNSGFADRILVDSRASFDYFRAGGIPAEQMAIAGSVSQDRMFEQRQNHDAALQALRDELGLPGNKPLLLISGCPNQLSAPVPYCEFATIEEVARFVGESVSPLADHYHLVVRPHPNFTEFAAMLEPFGVTSTTAATASLVPLADVFVAFASATIRWAIACQVPTVNYDVFHYGYGDFASAKGVALVDGSSEFRDRIRSLTPGSSALGLLSARAREDSDYWSVADGRSVARIEQEIEQARRRRMTVQKEQLQNA